MYLFVLYHICNSVRCCDLDDRCNIGSKGMIMMWF